MEARIGFCTFDLDMETKAFSNTPNKLIHESSPYLLQHAYNPVQWYPWGEEALTKAANENKMLLVSIGYSACHWCHVMEHESFEKDDVAAVMNKNFVCIKVDREERPDIDQVYMSAVQLMTGRGGWPLNCFALPDGRPVYGGTYFPRMQWIEVLNNLANLYQNDRRKCEEYAEQLTQGVISAEMVKLNPGKPDFPRQLLVDAVSNWKKNFDNKSGGPTRAPKFPLPNNYLFLLNFYYFTNDQELLNHIILTLDKMAFGGIYDQAGGGFARYSVDAEWKVPHFEKMLYDNAQLISLYSNAYRLTRKDLYKQVAYETFQFVNTELRGKDGNFYSALDADSEGEEGKYYIWQKPELENILGPEFPLFADYFNINERGYWEDGKYILLRHDHDEKIAAKYNLHPDILRGKIANFKKRLIEVRSGRIKPATDDKTLTSWNSLMITASFEAFEAFNDETFLKTGLRGIEFIIDHMSTADGGLFHNYKNNKSSVNGFLEDYSFFIQALLKAYQCTFNINWLHKAFALTEIVINNFDDPDSGMFFFTSIKDPALIARKHELHDNVIPASNSQMALNLFYLGKYFDNQIWIDRSKVMINNMKEYFNSYGSAFSNWMNLYINNAFPFYEIVICGKDALELRKKLMENFIPGSLVAGTVNFEETLPLLKGRIVRDKTLIYVCRDMTCERPVTTGQEALKLLKPL